MQSVDTWMRDAQSDKGEGGSAMVREDSECGGEREDGVRVWDEMREWRWEGFFGYFGFILKRLHFGVKFHIYT